MKLYTGNYLSYENINVNYNNLNNDEWAKKQENKINNIDFVEGYGENKILINLSSNFDNTKILDFSGGLGISYMILKKYYMGDIKYRIIETEKICLLGNKIFGDDKNISFSKSIKKNMEVDIVYIRTSLQYVKEWENLLLSLIDLAPKYFLFINLTAGNIRTFLTLQNWQNIHIPYWFFNIDDFKQVFFKNGYKIKYENNGSNILDNSYDVSVEKKFRISFTKNLIFTK